VKGTDCTPEQIQSAREFLLALARNIDTMPDDDAIVTPRFGDFARTVAWYGALRYKAGRDGTGGTLEAPGEVR